MRRPRGCLALAFLGCVLGGAALLFPLLFCLPRSSPPSAAPAPSETPLPSASPAVREYRAVWISYLEWQQADFTSEEAFRADARAMLQNCAALGATVVIAHVRPFGDALYPSELFPFSHLCTGVQGQDPGFDPLAILLAEADALNLEIEAWINPYRLRDGGAPARLAEGSPAAQHPDWVREVDGGLWLAPALTEVQDYIAAGVRELCERYDIAGIHFDDYFYPTADPAFDRAEYAAYQAAGGELPLADWRRETVSALVRKCYAAAHASGVRFGIAPQASLENNYNAQYSDVARWLAEPGYADYLMPQFYWGLQYEKEGDTASALPQQLARWQALPRHAGVQLYAGLGAYRIGGGDGADCGEEWNSGHALADQIRFLDGTGVTGTALYRYGSLFANADWPELSGQERAALREVWP